MTLFDIYLLAFAAYVVCLVLFLFTWKRLMDVTNPREKE